MGKVFAVVILLFALIMGVMFIPDMIDASHDAATDSQTDTANVTTGVGESEADMTLTLELFSDNIGYIDSATSGNVADNPIVESYDGDTGNITISGLNADDWRIMTVTYDADATEDYTGMAAYSKMMPTLMVLLLIGIVAASFYQLFKGRN